MLDGVHFFLPFRFTVHAGESLAGNDSLDASSTLSDSWFSSLSDRGGGLEVSSGRDFVLRFSLLMTNTLEFCEYARAACMPMMPRLFRGGKRILVVRQITPSFLPVRSRISAARSRSARLCVAVTMMRRRAVPCGTVG